MDLSLSRFERDLRARPLPGAIDMLLAAAAGRQAATPTARLAARLSFETAGRAHGAFERETAQLLLAGREQ
jgi:hypothetical protein